MSQIMFGRNQGVHYRGRPSRNNKYDHNYRNNHNVSQPRRYKLPGWMNPTWVHQKIADAVWDDDGVKCGCEIFEPRMKCVRCEYNQNNPAQAVLRYRCQHCGLEAGICFDSAGRLYRLFPR